ncbi:hypothetical protein VTK26DRAFT_4340 [Humicola hyalothermophila]
MHAKIVKINIKKASEADRRSVSQQSKPIVDVEFMPLPRREVLSQARRQHRARNKTVTQNSVRLKDAQIPDPSPSFVLGWPSSAMQSLEPAFWDLSHEQPETQ